jgi:hypothetical protein
MPARDEESKERELRWVISRGHQRRKGVCLLSKEGREATVSSRWFDETSELKLQGECVTMWFTPMIGLVVKADIAEAVEQATPKQLNMLL